ncbi:MAG: class I SAM-dependent methyltransferase [Endozoicomonas sp.]|uniref:class I SAM-dependent methyltransferase n=1 Tax=Endozoicomonas sp. TaxID=1892382 RepID=UPI003D9AB730
MKQNIYDHPDFFQGYKALRMSDSGLNGLLEEPAMNSLLPDLKNLSILDLGCGMGQFAERAINEGASQVTGIDISANMINEAKSRHTELCHFIQVPVEDFSYPSEQYDLVTSSLCFHYIKELSTLLNNIARTLKPGGQLIFSVEHPICTALLQGWLVEKGEKTHWPVDHYFDESTRQQHWHIDGVVKYHRTTATLLNTVFDAGLSLQKVLEPQPVEHATEQLPSMADHDRRPAILMVSAQKQ